MAKTAKTPAKIMKKASKPKSKPKTKAKPVLKLVGKAKGAKKKTPAKKVAQTKTARQPKAPAKPGSSVLWKFLEMKEQRRKEHAHEQSRPSGDYNPHQNDDGTHQRHSKFSRFAGPRRRVA